MTKQIHNQSQIAEALRESIDADRMDVVAILAKYVEPGIAVIEISDADPDDLTGDGGAVWVVSTHRLIIDGVEVAEWTRCACGHYGDQGRTEMVGIWCTEEDTDGGDAMPVIVGALLESIGIDDDIPCVPEPTEPDHEVDPEGEYCVYWDTVGDDSRPLRRYATEEQASEMRDVFARKFAMNNPSGGSTRMLCEHSIRQIVEGQWVCPYE